MLHTISPTIPKKKQKTVGRGGKRGKTSGRGTKGQKARAGHKIRPEIRDRIKKLPKLRGRGKNSNKAFRLVPTPVNLSVIEKTFLANEKVTPQILLAKGLIARVRGIVPVVKIVGSGLEKKVAFFNCEVSKGAAQEILAKGGTIGGYGNANA